MGFLSDHQHTEISDFIDELCFSDDNSTLFARKTVKLIRLIDGTKSELSYVENQKEAARKLRKLLKYNDSIAVKKRCFNVLSEFIIYNNCKFGDIYNDEKLLLAVKAAVVSYRKKTQFFTTCLVDWIKFIEEGRNSSSKIYRGIVDLYQNLSSKSQGTRRRFDLHKETPKIKLLIGDASSASIALSNQLLQLPNGQASVDNMEATELFVRCRELRRKILKYLQLIQGGELLGPLIHANDELVKSLKRYDELSGLDEVHNYEGTNSGSDSESSYYETDDEEETTQPETRIDKNTSNGSQRRTAAPPPRSGDNDPFGDHNEIY